MATMQYKHYLTCGSGSTKIILTLENGLFTLNIKCRWMGESSLSLQVKGKYGDLQERSYYVLQANSVTLNNDVVSKDVTMFNLEFIRFEKDQLINFDNYEDAIVECIFMGGAMFNYDGCNIFDGIILENCKIADYLKHDKELTALLDTYEITIRNFTKLMTGRKFLSKHKFQ